MLYDEIMGLANKKIREKYGDALKSRDVAINSIESRWMRDFSDGVLKIYLAFKASNGGDYPNVGPYMLFNAKTRNIMYSSSVKEIIKTLKFVEDYNKELKRQEAIMFSNNG